MASSRQKDTENLKLNVYQLSDLLLTRAKKNLTKNLKGKISAKTNLAKVENTIFLQFAFRKSVISWVF